MFFDTTSTYFEGYGPEGLAERGYSRDKRPDRVQLMIGLAMTREGIPVAHHVFPGNTADIDIFKRLDLKSCAKWQENPKSEFLSTKQIQNSNAQKEGE